MNWLVSHVASGQAFYSGIALLIAAALIPQSAPSLVRMLGRLAMIVGLIAVAISSTAIPYWYYGIAAVVTAAWMVCLRWPKRRRLATVMFAAVWLGAGLIELPYHLVPAVIPGKSHSLAVIGDSVTAGLGEGETTWPTLLAREHQLHVQDISHVGETAGSALRRARRQSIEAPLVIVEIGGNDLLGGTPADQFGRDLDALLTYVEKPGRQIVMFELPLPPFYHEYGRLQRNIAAKHHVLLIPKRVFLDVLGGDGATLDSIHLSEAGQQRMAKQVWQSIEPAYTRENGR